MLESQLLKSAVVKKLSKQVSNENLEKARKIVWSSACHPCWIPGQSMFKKPASLDAPFYQKFCQIPPVFASAWAGFSQLFLLLFGLDLMLVCVQRKLLAELLAAGSAEWLATSSAEVDTHRRWRRRCFYSVLEACGHALLRGGDNVTVLAQLNRPLSWLGLAFPRFAHHTYGGQFLYLHLFSFSILVNHDPNAISWVTP